MQWKELGVADPRALIPAMTLVTGRPCDPQLSETLVMDIIAAHS